MRIAAAAVLVSIMLSGEAYAAFAEGEAALNQKDFVAAFAMLKPDAEAGNAQAQTYIGRMYRKGQGVPKDPSAAATWFQKAAAQGEWEASNTLATMYRLGEGVPQDFQKAMQWYMEAAKLGVENAMYRVALMYQAGQGVQANPAEAYKWAYISAKHGGQPEPARLRDKLAKQLAPAVVEQAQYSGDRFLADVSAAIAAKSQVAAPATITMLPDQTQKDKEADKARVSGVTDVKRPLVLTLKSILKEGNACNLSFEANNISSYGVIEYVVGLGLGDSLTVTTGASLVINNIPPNSSKTVSAVAPSVYCDFQVLRYTPEKCSDEDKEEASKCSEKITLQSTLPIAVAREGQAVVVASSSVPSNNNGPKETGNAPKMIKDPEGVLKNLAICSGFIIPLYYNEDPGKNKEAYLTVLEIIGNGIEGLKMRAPNSYSQMKSYAEDGRMKVNMLMEAGEFQEIVDMFRDCAGLGGAVRRELN